MKFYDNSVVCGLVLNENHVAYICVTCALHTGSPVSLCVECFKNACHENHDYNMFLLGGVCGKHFIFKIFHIFFY